ncbi:MAG TPA: hypothetical protein VMM14_02810 [Acidimicrobiia bacterium]|nr:hypothetical protein [Acidimicrobiia bacterium]
MAVELDGNVRMRGDTGPGVGVKVLVESERLRLVAGNELVGDWHVSTIGVTSLQEGFKIKAEGEEFTLRTQDDVAFAEELGVAAASPRLARRLAARHNPEHDDGAAYEPPTISSNLAAIGFAVAGALVVLGSTFLNLGRPGVATAQEAGGSDFWIAFMVGGVLMIAVAYVMSIGTPVARAFAAAVLTGLVVLFGFAVRGVEPTVTRLTAFGFIAGGLVIGVAVLFSGSLRQPD